MVAVVTSIFNPKFIVYVFFCEFYLTHQIFSATITFFIIFFSFDILSFYWKFYLKPLSQNLLNLIQYSRFFPLIFFFVSHFYPTRVAIFNWFFHTNSPDSVALKAGPTAMIVADQLNFIFTFCVFLCFGALSLILFWLCRCTTCTALYSRWCTCCSAHAFHLPILCCYEEQRQNERENPVFGVKCVWDNVQKQGEILCCCYVGESELRKTEREWQSRS